MMEIVKNGGPVMIPLLICSIVSMTVILERIFFWIGIKRNMNFLKIEEILELCRQNRWNRAEIKTKASNNYIIGVLHDGLKHRDTAMSKAMESQATEEVSKMRRWMGVLDTIITVAPLLGIFGTVLGIIGSFDLLGAGIKEPSAITSGIAQALITTASGLGIAILTLFPYNYLISKIEYAIQRIEKYSTHLEIIHENALKHPVKSTQPARDHSIKLEPQYETSN